MKQEELDKKVNKDSKHVNLSFFCSTLLFLKVTSGQLKCSTVKTQEVQILGVHCASYTQHDPLVYNRSDIRSATKLRNFSVECGGRGTDEGRAKEVIIESKMKQGRQTEAD